jgi:hypothetical protein
MALNPPDPPVTPQHAGVSGIRRRRAWAFGGLVVVLVIAAATGLFLVTRPSVRHVGTGLPTPEPSRPSIEVPPSPDKTPSEKPSPSASRTAGPSTPAPAPANPHQANCAARPDGCGFPDAGNTGVPAGTKLAVVTGDLQVTQAGSVVEGKDVHGCVDVKAANVTIRRSRITCRADYGVASFSDVNKGGGLLIEDVEIDCGNTNTTGVGSYGFTARRVNIHGCENGFDVDASVTVVDSYLHDFYEGAAGHADGVQLSVGQHVVVSHNTIFDATGTSAMISNGTVITDVLVSGNLMAGGAYTMYCPAKPSTAYRVVNNRFSTLYYPKGGAYGPLSDCDKIAQFSGNVWDNNLQPLASNAS